ncbi:MAG: Gfo/Idh/MocA family oxidoreductase [Candidatus Hydrogenedentes bacterium]|nr:Gfo/Idh/MocA family oxidoreductase [Candidatus Hydrogenedentota bacterium]
MSLLKTGVVGVGHLGYHHARTYAGLEHVELAGVVDVDRGRAEKAGEDFGAAVCGSIGELVKLGVDAVSVAVPTTQHYGVVLELLKAGVDVLVEKPISATVGEGREMVAAARGLGRVLQVGHIERFNGAVMALMRFVKLPRFIECHRLSPYPSRGDDVSVVHDLMIHDLDLVLALVGTRAVQVDAVGVPVFSQYEDIANARIRFESGCVANLTCSRISVDRMRKIRVFEQDAYLSTDYSEQEVLVYRKKPGRVEPGRSPMELVTVESLPVEREEPLKRELESFVDCVRNGCRPVVSGEDGLAALELAQQVVDTARATRVRGSG